MTDGNHQEAHHNRSADSALIRWRPWPCDSCGGRTTPVGHIVRSLGSDPEISGSGRNEQIDSLKAREAELLAEWVRRCPHTACSILDFPFLDAGSEHSVFFDEVQGEVVKVTRPGTYGEYYEVIDGRIVQFECTPAEYLLRMRWWEKLFSGAPDPIGITETGQVVSRQRYIRGDPPSQESVDAFLLSSGFVPVKQECWLWKKVEMESQIEVWIGDARLDNFVSTEGGIIPIDIRVWGVPVV